MSSKGLAMSSSDDGDALAGEGVLLSYLAARETGAKRVLLRYIGHYPQYAYELLLLAFELEATASEGMAGTTIPHTVRDHLLVAARTTLLADTEAHT
jgi:hypothetical protein